MSTREVTPEQFDEISALLRQSRAFVEAAKDHRLTLRQKLLYLERAREARDQATAIGKAQNVQA